MKELIMYMKVYASYCAAELFWFFFGKKAHYLWLRLVMLACIRLKISFPTIFDVDRISEHVDKVLKAMPKKFILHMPFKFLTTRNIVRISIKSAERISNDAVAEDESLKDIVYDSRAFISMLNLICK